jgi:hypothetical protein
MPPDVPLTAGSRLDVVLPPNRLCFFGPAGGAAIRAAEPVLETA